MQTSNTGAQQQCPLCQQANQCNVADAARCWCQTVSVAQTLVASLAPDKRQQCICANCIAAYQPAPPAAD